MADHELVITPAHKLLRGRTFTTSGPLRWSAAHAAAPGTKFGAGFMHTDDGAIMAGQLEVATSWLPVSEMSRYKG